MEKKEMKGRRSEFCPSCSRVMMSYVNTMQDFLDKVVEEIEGNTPSSRRDGVPARTLIRDLSDVRKRFPRRGQISREVTSSTEASESRSQTQYLPQNVDDFSKSEHLTTDERISLDHLQEHIQHLPATTSEMKENTETSKYESFTPYQSHSSGNNHTSSPDVVNVENDYQNIPSPPINQSYEVHLQGHIQSDKLQEEKQESIELNRSIEVSNDQNSQQVLRYTNDDKVNTESTQKIEERNEHFEHCQKHEFPAQHRGNDDEFRPPPPPPPPPRIEDRYSHNPSSHDRQSPSIEEMPHIEPPSPEVPLPPTWVEKMLNICDIPLLLPPAFETEAYVTMATNNLTAVGATVLGNSLRLSNTSRTLAIIIADEVSDELRNVLASVFHVVQRISSLEPMGSTKLALLEQPELGISYSKLLVWRLTQFDKCVFLSPDTLVIQNCDELFERNEISAVPDVGWPDCFNTAVFVFTPSDETFWNLVDFAETKGSFDGGDQGLLNMYFRSWSLDIHKRLPFIYNLMANVSYTYGPAFVKFGGNAKVVHFFGTTKPWNIQFNVITGQVAPFSGVHPTFSPYVQYWLTIFARCVLPLFSQDVQEYSTSHNYVNALDLARIVTGSSDTVFSFSPPSFRRYLDSSEPAAFPSEKVQNTVLVRLEEKESSSESEEELSTIEKGEEETKDESLNDYNRMLAWEQGRMDYLGQDSSDNVLKRLDHAIKKADRSS